MTEVSSRLRHGGELHPRRQESRLVGSSVGAGVRARFEGLSSDVLRLSVERERHRCPAEQWPGGNVAEHGGAVLPVMAERHHPCCHTHPGAPLGVGNAPRVTWLGPVGTWVGGGAARAREWAITIFADSELVGIRPPSKAELIARLHAAEGASQEAFSAPVRAARVGPEAGPLCGVLCTGSPPAWIRQPAWGREGGIWPRSTEMANLESSRGQSDVGNESRDIGLPFKQRGCVLLYLKRQLSF